MSLQTKILRELEKEPRRLKYLKQKLGNDKKLARLLADMVRRGDITQKGAFYMLRTATEGCVKCRLVKLARGFGFARVQEEAGGDVFIPGKYLMGAMPGDEILVKVSPSHKSSPDGMVTAVTQECNEFVGTMVKKDGRLAIQLDACPNLTFAIRKGADGGAQAGEKAAVMLLERGLSHDEHIFGVTMRFGSAESARQCAKAILYGAGISRHFPQRVKEEAARLPQEVEPEAIPGRLDLRGEVIFTIDSASTKDIDDAISVKKTPAGYELGVHIADVSHYVRPGTELDKEAYDRGTSVYYADRVVPMLPRQLSNGICSLNEGVDRLAFSCIMELAESGQVTDYRFVKTVIHSRRKGVYEEINQLFAGAADPTLAEKYSEVWPSLLLMRELYQKLASLRAARGSMDIETHEAKILVDEDGVACDVVRREQGLSESMIEEFMLLANASAAGLAARLDLPFLYRVHEAPEALRVDRLKSSLAALGVDYHFAADTPTALELAALLGKTRGTNLETVVHLNILRTMAKAVYSTQPKGHFGLALKDYAQFTSPIRRYPDLAIHRVLSAFTAGEKPEELQKRFGSFMQAAASATTAAELRAMTAERDCDDCYKAEYMRRFLGKTFDGVITAVVPHGLYVELPNTVEGLLPLHALTKGSVTISDGVSLTDDLGGVVYRVGCPLKVLVSAVDVAQGHVDFELAPQ